MLRRRFYSFTIDIFAITIISKMFMFSLINYLKLFFGSFTYYEQLHIAQRIPGIYLAVIITASFFYFFIADLIGSGQTLGQKLFNLQSIVNRTENRTENRFEADKYKNFSLSLGVHRAAVRSTLSSISTLFLGCLPYLIIIFDKQQRTMQDIICNTIVVDLELATKNDQNEIVPIGEQKLAA